MDHTLPRAFAVFFASLAILTGQTGYGADSLPPSIAASLEAAKAPSPRTLREAETAWAAVSKAPTEGDAYAMAVALIANSKFPEAEATLSKLSKQQQQHFTIARTRLWLAVTLRKTDEIGPQLQQIVDTLLANTKQQAPTPNDLETAGFVGQILSYLENVGINSKKITPKEVRVFRANIHKQLPPPLVAAMKEKAEPVEKMIEAQLAKHQKDAETWEKIRLQNEKKLEAELAALEPEVKKAEEKLRTAEKDYETARQPRLIQWNQYTTQIRGLELQISSIRRAEPPVPPAQPKVDAKTNQVAQADQFAFQTALAKYQTDLADFNSTQSSLGGLEQQKLKMQTDLAAIDAQLVPQFRAKRDAQQAFDAIQADYDNMVARLEKKRAEQGRGVPWNAGDKAKFESLKTYDVYQPLKEVERITATFQK